ncbi:hypothetical protein CLOSTASPAR_03693 [[Clostridium] asparagiforme DSM 15981]|uniref:Uncharacterized protein n=1 Tax=[Clostridium] asparagiforme DSM 15981 TaxID=518636 RepID=C0D352_9FIRM|nr:hypothetical protein CLOSTASPAR_03693 [[Clostridium] asparagiforme DSM 15981]
MARIFKEKVKKIKQLQGVLQLLLNMGNSQKNILDVGLIQFFPGRYWVFPPLSRRNINLPHTVPKVGDRWGKSF